MADSSNLIGSAEAEKIIESVSILHWYFSAITLVSVHFGASNVRPVTDSKLLLLLLLIPNMAPVFPC